MFVTPVNFNHETRLTPKQSTILKTNAGKIIADLYILKMLARNRDPTSKCYCLQNSAVSAIIPRLKTEMMTKHYELLERGFPNNFSSTESYTPWRTNGYFTELY
jgi:hypothetical protein